MIKDKGNILAEKDTIIMKGIKEPYLKKIYENITTVVDKDTGDIMEEHQRVREILVSSKEVFFMMYAGVEGMLDDITYSELKILVWIMLHQAQDDNYVHLLLPDKKKLSEDMKVCFNSVRKGIVDLVKKDILIRQGGERSATYVVNPRYMWKGQNSERRKALEYILKLRYEEDNS